MRITKLDAARRQARPVNHTDRVILSKSMGLIAMRKGSWKLFFDTNGAPQKLYNIDEDPLELQDQLLLDSVTTRDVIAQLTGEGIVLALEAGLLEETNESLEQIEVLNPDFRLAVVLLPMRSVVTP